MNTQDWRERFDEKFGTELDSNKGSYTNEVKEWIAKLLSKAKQEGREELDAGRIIEQVLYNPQVSYPPISYEITDKSGEGYTSKYIDEDDFLGYIGRLEDQLLFRFKAIKEPTN